MKCRSTYFGDYEIELKVNDVLRGEKAEEQLYDLNIYGIEFPEEETADFFTY